MITKPSNVNKIAAVDKITTTQTKELKNMVTESSIKNKNTVEKTIDTLELGNGTTETFGTYKIDRQKLNQIKLDFAKNTDSFKEMVKAMLEKQGLMYERIEIDGETRSKAEEAISENGYWGVNKTAERLLDFAKTISGGDPSKIETLKNAFKEGYEKAVDAFGGTLPEISQMTYDKVMAGFDAWQNGDITEV